jgi:phospholipid/cholesterol/gamma-HCH transport system substrate-binding protein
MSRSGPGVQRGGVSVVGVVAIVAILAGVALALTVLLGDGDGHSYRLEFENGGQLVPGNQVLVGGQSIGSVDDITLTDDARAEVEITVDEPLHEGTTALVRATSLSGIANRYISVHPGPNSAAEMEDGTIIPADRTTAPVDLDQLFNTLDGRTRAALRDFIQGQATVYTGNTEAARETYKYFAPSLQAGERLFAELNRDQAALARFLVSGSRVFGAVASRRDDLSALTENGNRALAAIAAENDSFDRALAELPPAMRQANTTFVNLRAALDDLDPLIADTGRVAPELPGFLRDLRPVATEAVPVFATLGEALDRSGPDNDLGDSLRDLPPAERSARTAVPRTLAALDDSRHIFEFARPYSPDLLALVGKLGAAAGYYDFSGHYVRAMPAGSNLFAYDSLTEVLDPIPASDMFDAYAAFGLGPFIRCPGGATQPNPGWPSPTDHPFLDDGNLAGRCEPGDVPPGP